MYQWDFVSVNDNGEPACTVGTGLHHGPAHTRFVVDAQDDQLQVGPTFAKPLQPAKAPVTCERDVHDRYRGVKAVGALQQRSLVGHHDHRVKHRFEQAAHAFREAEVPVREQHTGEGLLGHQGDSHSCPLSSAML
jgi:hypothetical protein